MRTVAPTAAPRAPLRAASRPRGCVRVRAEKKDDPFNAAMKKDSLDQNPEFKVQKSAIEENAKIPMKSTKSIKTTGALDKDVAVKTTDVQPPLGSVPIDRQLPAKTTSPTPARPDDPSPVSKATTPSMGDSKEGERFKEFKKVVVAGASGGVGRQVVRQLAQKGVQVVALVRDPVLAAKKLPQSNVHIVQADVYQYATLPPALQDADAVICATGATDIRDPLGPFNTDYTGTVNLVEASKAAGIKHFVLVTSIGTDDPLYNPLNLFWGILFWKKRAEEHLQRSGLKHTIVRPGGLASDSSSKRGQGNLVMARAGTYGVPPRKQAGSVLRSKVAEVCIESLVTENAACKVVEVVASPNAPNLSYEQLFDCAR